MDVDLSLTFFIDYGYNYVPNGKLCTFRTSSQEDFALESNRGAFFAWHAHILSWLRVMCSQVRKLKFLEPSREMPKIRVFEEKKIVFDFP